MSCFQASCWMSNEIQVLASCNTPEETRPPCISSHFCTQTHPSPSPSGIRQLQSYHASHLRDMDLQPHGGWQQQLTLLFSRDPETVLQFHPRTFIPLLPSALVTLLTTSSVYLLILCLPKTSLRVHNTSWGSTYSSQNASYMWSHFYPKIFPTSF